MIASMGTDADKESRRITDALKDIPSATVVVWDSIAPTATTALTDEYVITPRMKVPEPEPEVRNTSGKCKFCGKWQSGLKHHENNVCDKRFRRKR